MTDFSLPIISPGQVYFNSGRTDYLVVTRNTRDHISYAGDNFTGRQDAEDFLFKRKPVNPETLPPDKFLALQALCSEPLSIGCSMSRIG